jgi:hypothetical protein
MARLIKGEVQTVEQAQSYQAATRRLFKEREILANLMRKETGHTPVVFPIHLAESEMHEENARNGAAVRTGMGLASGSATE